MNNTPVNINRHISRLLATLVIVLTGTILLPSCNTSGCTDNRSAIPLAGFYSSATLRAISLDSLQIHGVGAPGDSVLLAAGQSADRVYLPMRATANTTTWCLSYKWRDLDNSILNDTLTLVYTSEPWFAPDDCGAMYTYHITGVRHTDHIVDSVAVVDSVITNVDRVAIEIYFRTDEQQAAQRRYRAALNLAPSHP